MATPQPGNPTNPFVPPEIRDLFLRRPARPQMGSFNIPMPPMPTALDYSGAVDSAMGTGESDINALLGQLGGEVGQANSAAEYARNALMTGMAEPMPQMQAPNMNPLMAMGSLLGENMGSLLMRQPNQNMAFNSMRENQQTEQALALQKRKENLDNLRTNAERLAAQATKMGDLKTALTYQHKIETIDKQRAAMAEAGVHALDAQSAERSAAIGAKASMTNSANAAEASMYGDDTRYAAAMTNALLDFTKPSGSAGAGADDISKDLAAWTKQHSAIWRDVGALSSTQFKTPEATRLLRNQLIELPAMPGETEDQYWMRMQREGAAYNNGKGILNLSSPKTKDSQIVLARMEELFPDQMAARRKAQATAALVAHREALAAAELRQKEQAKAKTEESHMRMKALGFGLGSGRH